MDVYKVLQVHPEADLEVIRAAYRARLRQVHPDKNPERKEWAEKRTRELNDAFAILNDPEKRRDYDRGRMNHSGSTRQGTSNGPRPTATIAGNNAASKVTEDVSYSVLQNEYHRLEAELARVKTENRTFRGQIEQLTVQVNRREEDLSDLQRRLSEIDAQRLRLERSLSVAEKQAELLRSRQQIHDDAPARSTSSPPLAESPRRQASSRTPPPTAERITPPVEGRNVTLPGGDQTLSFLWIPDGTFEMGSPVGKPDERPVHSVRLDGFWMAVFPVTNKQFAAFLRNQPTWSKRLGSVSRHADYLREFLGDTPPHGKENHPVTGVPWHLAAAFCEWAGLALPTEAQWEYAARGGRRLDYSTSNGALLPRLANYGGNIGGTTPFRRFPPNPFGLCDMSGNVWEWCVDEYSSDFYTQPEAVEPNPLNGARVRFRDNDFGDVLSDSKRVMRGGSWRSVSADLRTSVRAYQTASLPTLFCGFRCVLLDDSHTG